MGAAARTASPEGQVLGRYVLFDEIASGGMASVHYGRMRGSVGFARSVAVKRLHPHLAGDPDFVSMFLDEARLAARIHHSNVVDTLDVVTVRNEIILVMEYVHGESLSMLLKAVRNAGTLVPPPIAAAIVSGVLHGLHAAHEATSEKGEPLGIVHRDVSPQNVIVGADGIARVLDFGVAKALTRTQTTREGQLKGKLAYMATEQLRRGLVDRRTDVYAAAVVLWETLTAERLHDADDEAALVLSILEAKTEPPSAHVAEVTAALDAVVMKGLSSSSDDRYPTALAMADALEKAIAPARPREVGDWVASVAQASLAKRAERLAAIERLDLDAPEHMGSDDVVRAAGGAPANSESLTMRLRDEDSRVVAVQVPAPIPSPSVTAVLIPRADTIPPRTAPSSSRRSPLLLGALLVVLVLFGGAWVAKKTLAAKAAAAAPPSATSAVPAPIASASPAVDPAPPAVPSPSASPSPSSSPPSTSPVRRSSSPVRGKQVNPCDPPYYIDADGVKHFKTKCL